MHKGTVLDEGGVSRSAHEKKDAAKTASPTCMVLPVGFEPAAYRLGGDRSIHLSYGSTNRKGFGQGVMRPHTLTKPEFVIIFFAALLVKMAATAKAPAAR